MYPGFLTVRHSDIVGSNGTYFWVQQEGGSPLWAKDGWQIVWKAKERMWFLLSPFDVSFGRTVKRCQVRVPPTNKRWCTRENGNGYYQPSAMEVVEVLVYKEGEEVLAKFKNRWYLGTVFRVHKDDTVDLWWHDQPNLKSSNIPFSYLKKSRRVSIKIKFENFENVSRLARVKIPLSWEITKLRNLIGYKTTTNCEEISLYLDDSAALPLSKKIGDLSIGSGTCLTAKKEAFEVFKKDDPEGTWSQGEKCEYFCSDEQWRKGTIKAVHVSKTGITADVETDDGKTNSVHVSMWHKHLRTPGTGFQAPLPPPLPPPLPNGYGQEFQYQVGEQVMVTIAKGFKKAATITTALNTAEGERPKWKVTFAGEYEEDSREYTSDVFERIHNSQQSQVAQTNINVLPLNSNLPIPGTFTRESVELNPPEAPPPSVENFQAHDLVHVLDGEAGKKIALVVSSDGNNMYTIAYIPQNKMENLRRVCGNLLVKDPDPIDNGGCAQTQPQPIQRPLSKDAIAVSIYSQVNFLSGDYEKKEDVSLQEVRRRLKNEYQNDNIEQILGCTLEDFFERGDQYEFKRGDGKSPSTVRLIAKFVQQEMRELNNKSNGLAESAGQMLQNRSEFHPPMQRPEVKAEINEQQLATLEQTVNSMCIFPTRQQLRQALESNFTLETQISYLLDRL